MVLQPAETARAPLSQAMDGYETYRAKHGETMNRVLRQRPDGPRYVRTKGTEPDYGNFSGWCAARARHNGVM